MQNKLYHTPGPWKPKYTSEPPIHLHINAVNKTVAGIHYQENFNEQEANAKLIAAAPQLLNACKRVMQLCIAHEGDEIFKEVEAAIAEAEGKR